MYTKAYRPRRSACAWILALALLFTTVSPATVLSEDEPAVAAPSTETTAEPSAAEPPVTAALPAETTAETPAPLVTDVPAATEVPLTPAPAAEAPLTEAPSAEALSETVPAEDPATPSPAATDLAAEIPATPSPVPGTTAVTALPLALGAAFTGELTGELSTLYARLAARSQRTEVVLTAGEQGLAVAVVVTNEQTGARRTLAPTREDGVDQPLSATLTLEAHTSYLFTITAAQTGATGRFRLRLDNAPATAEPSAEPAVSPESATAEPSAEPAVSTEPATAEPSAEPAVSPEPATAEPSAEPAVSLEPATAEPSVEPAVSTEPATAEPSVEPEDPMLLGKADTSTQSKTSRSHVAYTVNDLQSDHDYPSSITDTWTYVSPGAGAVTVTFSTQTYVENLFDFLRVYTGERVLVGEYTGTALAGQSVTVPGDTVLIELDTDSSVTGYGFSVSRIVTDASSALSLSTLAVPSLTFGDTASLQVRQRSGRGVQYYLYQLMNGYGEQVDSVVSASPVYQIGALPVGVYALVVTAYDGADYALYTSDVFQVQPPAPCALTVATVPSVPTGDTVTLRVTQTAGAPASLYHYIIADSEGRVRQTYDTDAGTLTFTAPEEPCALFVQVLAWDGFTWGSAISNWFSVTTRQPLSAVVAADDAEMTAGRASGFTADFSGGFGVTFARYTVYSYGRQEIFTVDTPASQVAYTPAADLTEGLYYVQVLAWDGASWAVAYGWFSVVPAQPFSATVAADSYQNIVGEPVRFTAVFTGGLDVVFTRYNVYAYDGTSIYSADLVSDTMTFTPSRALSAGLYYVELLAYDGASWAAAYGWFSLNSSAYRALVIGQGYYTSTGISTLPGTLQDSVTMASTLRSFAEPYTIVRKTEQTAAQILQDISAAFRGATENDVSLFFYSGHGSSSGSLVGTDRYGVSPTQLRTALDAIPGTKIVIIDACYSGAMIGKSFVQGMQDKGDDFVSSFISAFSRGSRSTLAASGYYVMTAASGTETSAEGSLTSEGVTQRVGLFSTFLCLGCGWNGVTERENQRYADENSDGVLTLDEVYTFAYTSALTQNKDQHAQVYPVNSTYALFTY